MRITLSGGRVHAVVVRQPEIRYEIGKCSSLARIYNLFPTPLAAQPSSLSTTKNSRPSLEILMGIRPFRASDKDRKPD